jgi:hypothetical protein
VQPSCAAPPPATYPTVGLPYSRPTLQGLPYRTYPTLGLPYTRLRPAPPPRLGLPQGRGRLPRAARRRADARAQDWNPRASRPASRVARGRLLEIPIQNGRAEVGGTRGTDPANAAGHNNVGGYMRGKGDGAGGKKKRRRGGRLLRVLRTLPPGDGTLLVALGRPVQSGAPRPLPQVR